MTAITITLPWPPAALSPNAGNANPWAARKARRAYREEAGWAWHAETWDGAHCSHEACGCRLTPPVVADITFRYTRKRNWDVDNHIAMLKPVWDGAKDASVIVDDNADVFSIGEVKFARGKERGVTVRLRRALEGARR